MQTILPYRKSRDIQPQLLQAALDRALADLEHGVDYTFFMVSFGRKEYVDIGMLQHFALTFVNHIF